MASQVIEGVHASRDVKQFLVQAERGAIINLLDGDRTLYDVGELRSQPIPGAAQARARPAALLGGHAAVTQFVDRDVELEVLTHWYESPGHLSALLVHGPGGQGKTRLMRQFAGIVRERPERPQVREAFPPTEVVVEVTGDEGNGPDRADEASAGILLVVDEADTWAQSKLLSLFRDVATWRCERVRVLLSARASGMWWSALQAELGMRAELDRRDVTWPDLPLVPLAAGDMRELATAAGRCQAAALDWPEPPPLPQEVWKQLEGSPPLSAELMVLARLDASNTGQPEPGSLRAAVELVLEKELRYWARMYGTESVDTDKDAYRIGLAPGFMARVVYVATLTGPRGPYEAEQMVKLARIGCNLDPQQVVDDHARCYPPQENQRLAPLPPCLAEEFLGMFVPDAAHPTGVLAQDAWATDTPFRVLGLMPPLALETEDHIRRMSPKAGVKPPPPTPTYSPLTFGPQLQPAILKLVRAASTRAHIAEKQLYPLARLYPRAVVMAGSTALSELINIHPEPPDDVLKALEQAATECDPENTEEWLEAMDELARRPNRDDPGHDDDL